MSGLDAELLAAALALAAWPWSAGGSRAGRGVAARTAGWRPGRGQRGLAGRQPVGTPVGGSQGAVAAQVDVVLVLELVDAALATGAALPRALDAVGRAVGGPRGESLRRASAALLLGAPWSTAWSSAPPALAVLAEALEPAWSTGSAPGPALRAAADGLRRQRRVWVREAAGSLGVRLVLPLGLCFLPSFLLLGLVPVVLSLAGGVLG